MLLPDPYIRYKQQQNNNNILLTFELKIINKIHVKLL